MTPTAKPAKYVTSKRNLLWAALVLIVLSLVSGSYFRHTPPANLEQKNLEHYLHKQQQEFARLVADTPLLRRLARKAESLQELQRLESLPFGIYLFPENASAQDPLFWNNQDVLPPGAIIAGPEGTFFQKLANGYYVIQHKKLQLPGLSFSMHACALIPVYYNYNISSFYLEDHFAHSKEAHKKIAISLWPTTAAVKDTNGKTLFYLSRKAFTPEPATDAITFYLRLGALVLLLVYLHLTAEAVVRRWGAVLGVGLLAAVLLLALLVINWFPALLNFPQFGLFGPQVYGSNWLNPSLGDLLLNAGFFCWMVIFAWQHAGPVRPLPPYLRGWRLYAAGGAALFLLILATFQMANVVRSLVADSKISFQVTDFFSLSRYTAVGFAVLALLSLGYYYFTRLLFRFIFPAFKNRRYLIYFFIGLIGLVFLTFRSGHNSVLFHIPVLLWLVIYTFLFSQHQSFINYFRVTLAGVLFWIFVFSASLAAIIVKENKEKQWAQMETLADRQDQRTDPSQERTLSIAFTYLDERFFSDNFHRFTQHHINRYLRDSIAAGNFHPTYREAYNTQLYAFDSARQGLFNEDARTYDELENIYSMRARPTDIPGLSYYEPDFDQVVFLAKREVQDSVGGVRGTFFILSAPKRYNSDNFLPELFSRKARQDVENSPLYSYGVYQNDTLVHASSLYAFKTSLTPAEKPATKVERRQNEAYNELWYKAGTKKTIIIAKKRDTWLESITLFSYLFCAFLLMVALLQAFALLLRTIYGWKLISVFSEISIRAQVHGTIIFISLLSFLIIGAATITFFVQRYNRNNVEKISRTSGIMTRELERRLKDVGSLEFVLNTNDSAGTKRVRQIVDEVAQIHLLDVNLYDLQGDLRFSSIDLLYNQGLISNKMHPEAFYHLNQMRQVQFWQREEISRLDFLSLYTAVRNRNGRVQAYLNIPYFNSQLDLQQEISNFLVTIINLNAFIFLIAGVIALFIANRITRSFSVIGEKMRAITLGKTNEEIVWTRKDEIGELVAQYNKMVHQLEASAEALARSEREGAWREMARQVAHEIKNPLTPMKLSIQYLQKAISNGHPNVQELTTRVANTLVEQIYHLSKIAADFSRFANIGNQQPERFDLHDVLEGLTDLYKSNPKVNLQWQPVPGPVWLHADKTHINRLFTNLLSNAVEACNERDACYIKLEEARGESSIQVRVRDNGEGISVATRQKIFVPNFTTKTSGTGLGLAMCKGIVEQAGGRIWFETEEGVGTTFFVELPVTEER